MENKFPEKIRYPGRWYAVFWRQRRYQSFGAGVLAVFLWLCSPLYGFAEEIRGRVTDAATGEPLAFVHVVVKDSRQGTMTDIDGVFRMNLPGGNRVLQLSYVGYFSRHYEVEAGVAEHVITMHRRPFELEEVVVYPGENPAHRIIRNTISNRTANDPERLQSFSYTSYNKFLATLERDFYEERWLMTGDSAHLRIMETLDKRHVFLMESVTERMFLAPDRSNEKVIANRVSGLQDPLFTMLATELQPFSFYKSTISILENEYLSPLNRAAFNRYFYHLEDTLYQDADTLFVVSFRPGRNTNFDGLKGLLYIHTDRWAIQNVVAEPARQIMGTLNFRIQQKYSRQQDGTWFPVQLNTDIDFFNPEAADPSSMVPIKMMGRSYIQDIQINPGISRGDMSAFAIDFSPDANKTGYGFWEEFRPETLTGREANTYHFMDSLGAELNFDRILNSIEPIAFGDIPMGMFNIPLNSIYRFNDFERHRFGLGLNTNRRFSRRVELGGHYAWGTGDKESKYGYYGELVLHKNRELRVGGAYHFDVSERGGSHFMQQTFLLGPSLIRSLYMDKMDYTRRTSAYLSFMALRNFLTAEMSVSRGKTFWTDLYYYAPESGEPGRRSFRFAEAAVRLRYAYGEVLMNTPTRIIRLPSGFPVFHANITKGFDNAGRGELNYLRAEARLDVQYSLPLLGQQSWIFEGGWTDRDDLPWPLLFTAKAGNKDFYLAAPFSFGTMTMNEFVASRYVSLFFQHNFGSLLFRRPGWEPELALVTNMGAGKLNSPENHLFMEAGSWHKGYFESGVVFNKIFPARWVRRVIFGMSPGIEVLYRYGPYALDDPLDNITIKLNMVTSF